MTPHKNPLPMPQPVVVVHQRLQKAMLNGCGTLSVGVDEMREVFAHISEQAGKLVLAKADLSQALGARDAHRDERRREFERAYDRTIDAARKRWEDSVEEKFWGVPSLHPWYVQNMPTPEEVQYMPLPVRDAWGQPEKSLETVKENPMTEPQRPVLTPIERLHPVETYHGTAQHPPGIASCGMCHGGTGYHEFMGMCPGCWCKLKPQQRTVLLGQEPLVTRTLEPSLLPRVWVNLGRSLFWTTVTLTSGLGTVVAWKALVMAVAKAVNP